MADFKTHLIAAAAISGVASSALQVAGTASQGELITYFALGVTGGLLPDIDLDHSIILRAAFSLLGVTTAFLGLFALGRGYSLVELVLIWTSIFLLVRFGLLNLFGNFTVHRGLLHSLPAAAISGLATLLIAHEIGGVDSLIAWRCAAFVCIGFLVHLVLDEIYSVDLLGARFKKSFGSAIKLGSFNQPVGTAALYIAVVLMYWLAPSPESFLQKSYIDIRTATEHLLPEGRWFAVSTGQS